MYILNISSSPLVHKMLDFLQNSRLYWLKGQGTQGLAIKITEKTSIRIKYEFSLLAFRAMKYLSDFSSLLRVEVAIAATILLRIYCHVQ